MIGSLFGHLTGHVYGNGRVLFKVVGGVGYVVALTDRDHLALARRDTGEPVELLVHTVITEDSHTLYGFLDADDEQAFRSILSIKGCGPALGMKVLSSVSAKSLRDVAYGPDRREAERTLTRLPGIGPKTAQLLVIKFRPGDMP